MKKITANLGSSHSEFDHQLKDVLNDISESLDALSKEQQLIIEYQSKLFLKQHAEVLQSPICETCRHKACIMTINIPDGTYKSFCNDCLTQ
jgi:hypothetical protein